MEAGSLALDNSSRAFLRDPVPINGINKQDAGRQVQENGKVSTYIYIIYINLD